MTRSSLLWSSTTVLAIVVGIVVAPGATDAAADPVPPPDPSLYSEIDPAPTPAPGVAQLTPCPTSVPDNGVLIDGEGAHPSPWQPVLEEVEHRGRGQTVAVIDTGVALHPRLRGRVVDGGDYVGGGAPRDCDGHGTAVAGLIAAAPGPSDPFAGVAPEARVLALRQSSQYFGRSRVPGAGDLDTMARALRSAVETPGVGVVNISLDACVSPAAAHAPAARRLQAAAHEAAARGVVVVAAAGNVGAACPQNTDPVHPASLPLPAAYTPDVLAVGVVAPPGAPSVAGPWVRVTAPGTALTSLDATDGGLSDHVPSPSAHGSVPISGSSFAAALVSGLVAVLRAQHPELTAAQVIATVSAAQRPGGLDPALVLGVARPLAGPPPGHPGSSAPSPDRAGGDLVAECLTGLAALGVLVVGFLRRRRRTVER